MKVDVFDLPNYGLSDNQHEWLWLFSIMVAGKKAEPTRDKLNAFLKAAPCGTPFEAVRTLAMENGLDDALRRHRVGQYRRIGGAFRASVKMTKPIWECKLPDLEVIPGVGPKTARFYYMMTRPNARMAALDTHILKFLRDQGHDAPKVTPPHGPTYERLEQAFLAECDKRGVTNVAAFDLEIWKEYRSK